MIYAGEMKKVSEGVYRVGLVHYMPFDEVNGLGKTQEQLQQEGILVEALPEKEDREGYEAELMYNGTSLYYEYVLNQESQEQRIADLENAIADLVYGGAV